MALFANIVMAKSKENIKDIHSDDDPKWVTKVRLIVFSVIFLTALALSLASDYSPFLSSTGGSILIILLYIISFLFLIFFRKKQLPYLAIFYAVIADFLFFLLPLFISTKIHALITWIYAILGFVLLAILHLVKKKEVSETYHYWILLPALCEILPSAFFLIKVDFLSSFPFWLASLIISLLTASAVLIYSFLKKKEKVKDQKLQTKRRKCPSWLKKVGYFVMALFLSFLASWESLGVLNTCFDFSEGQLFTAEVVDKNIDYGTRHTPNLYNLEVDINGEEREISVPKFVYNSTENGDFIDVMYFDGLLGETYYVYLGYLQ